MARSGTLDGKVAIVTGAASPIGLGHAIALAFVRAGARVAMLDVKQEWLDERLAEMRAIGGSHCAIALATDVADPAAGERGGQTTIAELGGLHIPVNNAGLQQSSAS